MAHNITLEIVWPKLKPGLKKLIIRHINSANPNKGHTGHKLIIDLLRKGKRLKKENFKGVYSSDIKFIEACGKLLDIIGEFMIHSNSLRVNGWSVGFNSKIKSKNYYSIAGLFYQVPDLRNYYYNKSEKLAVKSGDYSTLCNIYRDMLTSSYDDKIAEKLNRAQNSLIAENEATIIYNKYNHYKSGISDLKKAINDIGKYKDLSKMAEYYYHTLKTELYQLKGDFLKAYNLGYKILNCVESNTDINTLTRVAGVYYNMSNNAIKCGKYINGLELSKKAISLNENSPINNTKACFNAFYASLMLGYNGNAEFYLKSIEKIQGTKLPGMYNRMLLYRAWLYNATGEIKKSLYAIELMDKVKPGSDIAFSLRMLKLKNYYESGDIDKFEKLIDSLRHYIKVHVAPYRLIKLLPILNCLKSGKEPYKCKVSFKPYSFEMIDFVEWVFLQKKYAP